MADKNTPIRIILADDDEDDRTLFYDSITESSISALIRTVNDGEKLMALLLNNPEYPLPDVIFLDIHMPLKNGIECLEEIRSNEKFINVPIFMFTASDINKHVDTTYEKGANLYIDKTVFFSKQKEIIEKIFSVHMDSYLSTVSKDAFNLTP